MLWQSIHSRLIYNLYT